MLKNSAYDEYLYLDYIDFLQKKNLFPSDSKTYEFHDFYLQNSACELVKVMSSIF